MNNLFGITAEELENFKATAPESLNDLPEDAREKLLQLKEAIEQHSAKVPAEWLAKAKIIGKLPGLSDAIKIACIYLGSPQVLSQVLLIHAVAQDEMDMEEAVAAFVLYCQTIGVDEDEISHWLGFMMLLGIIQTPPGDVPVPADISALESGPLLQVVSLISATKLQGVVVTMKHMKPILEALGVEFSQDMTVYGDRKVQHPAV